MTVTAPQNAYALIQAVPDFRLYSAPRGEFFGEASQARTPGAKTWTRKSHLKLESFHLTSGSTPATATVRIDLQPDDALVATPNNLEDATDLGPTGLNDTLAAPKGFNRWDAIKVCIVKNSGAEEEEELCLYVGFIADWEIDLATGQVWLFLEDFRRPLAGVKIWGERWMDETTTQCVWLPGALPVFNPKGRGNLYRYFATALDGRNLGFVDPLSQAAGTWRRGDIWNYLRRVYSTNPERSNSAWTTANTAPYLDWPEATAGGFAAALFQTTGASYEAALPQWALGGMALPAAIDLLVRKRADRDWTATYDGSTGRARFKLYGTGATSVATGEGRKSFRWADIAKTPAQAQPEIPAGRVRSTAEKTATMVRAFGAPKLYDLTFTAEGSASDTLEPAWTAADETAWLALYDAEDSSASTKYPMVFRRWKVKSDCDFKTLFGWTANIVRKRTGEAYLRSYDGDDKALRIRCLVWRKIGTGAWEICPEEMRPAIADGVLGIEFPEGARHEREWSEFSDEETWTWNGDASAAVEHKMRVTICVEADERLHVIGQDNPDNWPRFEELLQDEGYVYKARRAATLRTLAGKISRNGDTDTPYGVGSDDEIYDANRPTPTADLKAENRLRSAALALHNQKRRTDWTGDINLKNIRADVLVGDYIERLRAGGSAGERPDLALHSVVRSVTFHIAEPPITTVRVESY